MHNCFVDALTMASHLLLKSGWMKGKQLNVFALQLLLLMTQLENWHNVEWAQCWMQTYNSNGNNKWPLSLWLIPINNFNLQKWEWNKLNLTGLLVTDHFRKHQMVRTNIKMVINKLLDNHKPTMTI